MTSPDSNDDATSNKYHVQIGEGQGIVIGDNAQVVQRSGSPGTAGGSDRSRSDLPTEGSGGVQVAELQRLRSPDLSLANVPLEEVFVRLTLTVEKVIREPCCQKSRARPSGVSVAAGTGDHRAGAD